MTLEPVPWLDDEPDWFDDELFDPLEVDESSEEESSDHNEFDESSEDELPVLLEFACCAALLVLVLPR